MYMDKIKYRPILHWILLRTPKWFGRLENARIGQNTYSYYQFTIFGISILYRGKE